LFELLLAQGQVLSQLHVLVLQLFADRGSACKFDQILWQIVERVGGIAYKVLR
jgi:hypothetical protein